MCASASARPGANLPAVDETDPQLERFALKSSGLGLEYRIFVAKPSEPAPPRGYQVIYLLDGAAAFPLMRKAQQAAGDAGPILVVGVGYPTDGPFDVPRRYFDLTPLTPPELIPTREGHAPRKTGGEEAFLAFIETDLKPAIERRFPVDRARQTLFGHSLGGRFVLHTLFTRPDAFQTYVAADPSIWWKGGSILKEKAAFLARRRAEVDQAPQRDLLISTSGKRGMRRDVDPAYAAQVKKLRAGPTGKEVAADLQDAPRLRVAYRHFAEESHISILPGAVADALLFALGRWPDEKTDGGAAPEN